MLSRHFLPKSSSFGSGEGRMGRLLVPQGFGWLGIGRGFDVLSLTPKRAGCMKKVRPVSTALKFALLAVVPAALGVFGLVQTLRHHRQQEAVFDIEATLGTVLKSTRQKLDSVVEAIDHDGQPVNIEQQIDSVILETKLHMDEFGELLKKGLKRSAKHHQDH